MQGILFAFLTAVAWSARLLILRGAVSVWPVGLAGMFSRFSAAVLLLLWVSFTGRGPRRLRAGQVWDLLLVMGFVASTLNILLFFGMRLTTATNATFVLRLDLLFVVLIGSLLKIERITIRGLATIPFMILGLALLMEIQKGEWGGHVAGDALIILSALGLAVNAFVIRRIMRSIDEETVAFYNMLLCAVGFGVLASFQGLPLPKAATTSAGPWFRLLALGVSDALATALYYAALRRLQVWRLRALLLINPFMVAVVEWLWFGLEMNSVQWIGSGLLLGGVMVLIWDEARSSGIRATG
jgi:drug/metabolite transporter (DMT)-like permease